MGIWLLFTDFLRACFRQEEELERLEREFAIQSQITEAARRLASDPHVSSKKLKKQRKTSYLNALKKLQEIENSINEYRVRSGKKPTQRASLIIEGTHNLLCATGKSNPFHICFCLSCHLFFKMIYSSEVMFGVFSALFQSILYLFLHKINQNMNI